jgi:acetyl-CoA C-acetyltransferase
MNEAYIIAAVRTAGGRRGGRLANWHPVDLAAQVINALVDRTDCDPEMIEDVVLGCVSQAGQQSMNVARNAVLASRLPESVPGTSLDRQCGSSQQALHFAAQAVMSGNMGPDVFDIRTPREKRVGQLCQPEHAPALSRSRIQPVHRRRNDG